MKKATGDRRHCGWLAAAALLGAVLAFPAQAQAPAKPGACAKADDIRVMIFASLFNNMLTYIANDAGFFTRNCLNATLVPVNTGPAGMAQLQAGSLHFSDSSFDNTLIARHRGLPIKVVVGGSTGVIYSIVARKAANLPNAGAGYPKSMTDLVGKKIGVFGLGTGSELFVKTLLRGAGIDSAKVTFVAVGSTPTQFAALENGAVDAVIMADPGQDMAVASGFGQIIVDLRKAGVGPKEIQDLVGTFQVKVASEAFIKEKPEVVRRYVEANRQAEAWIRDPKNFNELVRLMKPRVALGREVANADALFTGLVKQYAGFTSASIKRSSVAGWNQLQISAGNIPAPIPLADVVWAGAPMVD
jgi:ABC-type nitrate/sulfonate/bicarbonate transport system substrate-binding protein